MSVSIRGLGFFSANNPQDEFDFAAAYANNLAVIKAEYDKRNIYPTEQQRQHARIASAVHAATDISRSDSMGAFFLNSQDPEDDMFDNFLPSLDWF